MKKILSIGLISLMILTIITPLANAVEQDNLIVNGTFDENMDNWNLLMSENFTISSEASNCVFNTTHTDLLADMNYTDFQNNVTLVNMTYHYNDLYEGTPTPLILGDGYIELVNTTTNLFNLSSDGWEYQEVDYPEGYFVQDGGNYTIESKQNPSFIVPVYEDYDTDEPSQANFQGNGENYFKWNDNNAIECEFINNWTGFDISARRYWDIPDIDNRTFEIGDTFTYDTFVQLNNTIPHDSGSMTFIIMNKTFDSTADADGNANGILASIYDGSNGYDGYWGIRFYAGGSIGDDGYIAVSGIITDAEFTDGVWLTISNEVISTTPFFIEPTIEVHTDSYVLKASETLPPFQLNYTLDSIAISNLDYEMNFFGSQSQNETANGNVSHIGYWHIPASMSTNTQAQFTKTINITKNMTVDAKVLYKHYYDAQAGYIYSNATLNNNQIDGGMSDYVIYTNSKKIPLSWREGKLAESVIVEQGTLECNLSTIHSTVEGNIDFPAKSTQWKDLWVNGTTYNMTGEVISNVKTMNYLADWLEFTMSVEKPYDTTNQYFIAYTRNGDTDTPDGSWSSWYEVTNWYSENNDEDLTYFGHINSPNSVYGQYRVEFYNNITEETMKIHSMGLYLTQAGVNDEWGSIEQKFTKPYTNYTTLKYDYKIDYLNNTSNGNITVMVDDYVVAQHDFTFFETNWITEIHSLPIAFNSSGTYSLNITVESSFNSTNGTAIIFFDNIELLIENQAPIITSFNVHNGTSVVDFNGTFTDHTRDSNFNYLGMTGIESANISIGIFEFDIDTITYIGNGTFWFETTWIDPPFEISRRIILNATVTVTDTTDLYDTEMVSVQLPRAFDWIMALMTFGFVMVIIILIFQRHLMTGWDSNKSTSDENLLPNIITGDK